MKRLLFLLTVLFGLSASVFAVDVTVTMNTTTKTMTLASKTGDAVEVGEPTSVSSKNQYSFSVDEGTYVLTGYNSSDEIDGTIELNITSANNEFQIWTASFQAANSGWVVNEDYTVENYSVRTREGQTLPISLGSTCLTALVTDGGSFNCTFVPSAARKAEGYVDGYGSATFTANATPNGTCPKGGTFTVSYPSDANFVLMRKEGGSNGSGSIHYVAFPQIAPVTTSTLGGVTTKTYTLGESNTYNYRLWKEGHRTKASKFVYSQTKLNGFAFTAADLDADPKAINHDASSNLKYNVGNILVNVNERGHLRLKKNETKNLLAQRDWQLTNNSTDNYFIEPDYHYTIVNLDGTPITIDNADTTTDPWATLHANSKGTALVLVNYDAIHLTQWTSAGVESDYLGGADWGACWPENTAVFVVTVDDEESSAEPNMLINDNLNEAKNKLAYKNVDAEHDVFYYLDTEEGANYTFTPKGVSAVEIAYPTILTNTVSYNKGFNTVTANEDGSYTLLLKFGRNIVKMTDASGAVIYQVLTAKPVHREISNVSCPGATTYMAGEKISIQYSGLYHPANKMAGIYNMSAYITYNGVPTGTDLILGSNQYQFAGTPSAQAVTMTIPADWDVQNKPNFEMTEGVLQVTGYGDPIGNHRNINRGAGRSPNFTAIAHKTYFGQVPDVSIPLYTISIALTPTFNTSAAVDLVIKDPNGIAVNANEDGTYTLTKYGSYRYLANSDGCKTSTGYIVVSEESPANMTIEITLEPGVPGWDGKSMSEPEIAEGVYQIGTGAELAWFANEVNEKKAVTIKGALTEDIELCDNAWTSIGTTTTLAFKGTFDGQGHTVSGLYIYSTASNLGLFGCVNAATIQNLIVDGTVTSTGSNVGGVAGYSAANTKFINCYNKAKVSGKEYVGGILGQSKAATNSFTNCANSGQITASGKYAGGIAALYLTAYTTTMTNVVNAGYVSATGNMGAIFGCANANAGSKVSNAYTCVVVKEGEKNVTVVSKEKMTSGELAYELGEPWGQKLGTDPCPVPNGITVYLLEDGTYSNTQEAEEPADYELTILTFEDEDYKGDGNYVGTTDWSTLIDDPQYGGLLLYGDYGMGVDDVEYAYCWTDDNNTWLSHTISEGYGSWCYWSGGHAVSNYGSSDIVSNGTYETQLTVYNKDSEGDSREGNGHNGSNNFAVHYGYADNSGYGLGEEALPRLKFADGKARVIDHMYINNTTYALNCYLNGNDLTANIGDDDWVKIVATGDNGKTAEFYLCNGPKNIITEWTMWDLSSLGKVKEVSFNITGSSDNGAGFSQPAYFAYDDVAVRIPKPTSIILADKSEYTSSEEIEYAQLTYTRTFGTTKWQPLYVPFTSDYSAWSEDVEIAEITSESEDGKTLTITVLEEGSEVKANTPYFIKAKKTGDIAIEVENATLVSAENASLTCGNLKFTGIYSPIVIQPNTYYVLHSGSIVKTSNTAGYNLPSMRWYAESANGGEIKIRVAGTDIETTIADIEEEDQTGAIYSTNGVRQQNLRKGINIVRMSDGTSKKIMVK